MHLSPVVIVDAIRLLEASTTSGGVGDTLEKGTLAICKATGEKQLGGEPNFRELEPRRPLVASRG